MNPMTTDLPERLKVGQNPADDEIFDGRGEPMAIITRVTWRGVTNKNNQAFARAIVERYNAEPKLRAALTKALEVLAVFKITDAEKTYVEISPQYRQQLLDAHDEALKALATQEGGR